MVRGQEGFSCEIHGVVQSTEGFEDILLWCLSV